MEDQKHQQKIQHEKQWQEYKIKCAVENQKVRNNIIFRRGTDPRIFLKTGLIYVTNYSLLLIQVELTKFEKLAALGVNLTEVLVAQEKVPDKFYRIDTNGGSDLVVVDSAATGSSSRKSIRNGALANDIQMHIHDGN